MNGNTGQFTLGIGVTISLVMAALAGAGFIYGVKADIVEVKAQHEIDVGSINGKLDILLKNFNLEYVPKK